jgi:hypothetical protein
MIRNIEHMLNIGRKHNPITQQHQSPGHRVVDTQSKSMLAPVYKRDYL